MAKKALVVRVQIDGVRETLAKFRGLPKDATVELRAASLKIAQSVAEKARHNAQAQGRQARILAPTVKPVKDRVPAVQAGGSTRIGRNRKPAYKLLFGSEFGATYLDQFLPHLGRRGYWFFPTVEDAQAEISEAWNRAADDIVNRFSEDG